MTQNSGMVQHIIFAWPIISIDIGICTRLKIVIPTRKRDKEEDKKELTSKSNQVTVDADKLKKGMAALFPSGDFDTDDLAEALSTAIANTK